MKTPDKGHLVVIESPDLTALLVDFLSEVLTLSHLQKAVYGRLSTLYITDQKFESDTEGISASAFDQDIKAVT